MNQKFQKKAKSELDGKSPKELLHIIDKAKERIKKTDVIKELCDKYNVDVDYIDLVPMTFADLDVSARTDKGIIYFNSKLLDDGDFLNDDHYMAHELTHHFQQCHGDGPTVGGEGDDYLDNQYEIEGFQTQTKYLSETRDNDAAEEYIEQVLDHHDMPHNNERKEKKDELLNIAMQNFDFLKEAGLFTVPEKLTKKISGFVQQAYASNVLYKAEKELAKGIENNTIWDTLESEDENGNISGIFEDIGDFFFDALPRLNPGENVTFNIGYHPETKLKNTKYAIKGYLGRNDLGDKYVLYVDGGFDNNGKPIKVAAESDRNKMEKYLSETHKKMDKYIESLNGFRNNLSDHLLEGDEETEYKKLIEKCKEYGGSNKVWSEMWPISLEELASALIGSKYAPKDFVAAEAVKKLEEYKWPPVITVEMIYKNKIETMQGAAFGQWIYGPMSIEIAVGDLQEYSIGNFQNAGVFDARIHQILNTTNHETIHMLQFLLSDINHVLYGLPSKKFRDPSTETPFGNLTDKALEEHKNQSGYTGNPRDQWAKRRWMHEKRIIDKQHGQGGHIPHSLMDIEFYTNLSDAVNFFNKVSENETPELRIEHAKSWVGAPNKFADLAKKEGLQYFVSSVRPDPFFEWLKHQAPKKWQKAIKEFFKATNVLV